MESRRTQFKKIDNCFRAILSILKWGHQDENGFANTLWQQKIWFYHVLHHPSQNFEKAADSAHFNKIEEKKMLFIQAVKNHLNRISLEENELTTKGYLKIE